MNINVRAALDAFHRGLPVIVCDDTDREDEADIIMAAELASAHWIGWTIEHSSRMLCAPMTNEIANRLELPAMVGDNRDPKGTAYTVTVDARTGVGTGIGAKDRTRTLKLLACRGAAPTDFVRPGHVFPLRAHPAGLTGRRGHTEAAVALCELARLVPVGVIAEAVGSNGEPLTRAAAVALAAEFALPVIDVAELAEAHLGWTRFRPATAGPGAAQSERISRRDSATIATRHGEFRMIGYYDCATGAEHVAIVAEVPGSCEVPYVRIHSQCMTSESFGSLRCDCAEQLDASLAVIARSGGTVVYLNGQEGRGIGLTAKIAAYRLQDECGLDTVDANLAINAPVDAREYGAAIAILRDLDVTRVRLLTGNPAKIAAARRAQIHVECVEQLAVPHTRANRNYLQAKRSRLGHVC